MIYALNDDALTVFTSSGMHTITRDSFNFKKCWEAVKNKDESALEEALKLAVELKEVAVSANGVTVTNDGVFYNGKKFECNVSQRIMDFLRDGVDYQPLVKFLERFLSNPSISFASNPETLAILGISKESADRKVEGFISDFWAFLNHKSLPVCEDGCFLAYKTVRGDFKDKYTGTIDNSVGQVVKMDRKSVDPDRNRECSYGLHVGCLSYAGPGGWYNSSEDNVVIVKVAPENVVAVPPDFNRTKMRVCEYEVIGIYSKPLDRAVYSEVGTDLDKEVGQTVDVTFDDIFEGDSISFMYKKKDNTSGRRHLYVEEILHDEEGEEVAVCGILLDPEEEAGEWRRFNVDSMSDFQFLE